MSDEFDEEWFRKLNLYDADREVDDLKMDELIEKAKKDPFYNKALQKSKSKKESSKKSFSGYNWTTHKKKVKGLKASIKALKAKEIPTDEDEKRKREFTLKRMNNLLKWHQWALKHHKDGKSDKWIHRETQKRRKEAKASK